MMSRERWSAWAAGWRSAGRALLALLAVVGPATWQHSANAAEYTLTWIDHAQDEDGFRIERKLGPMGPYVEIAVVGGGVTTFVDAAADEGVINCYRVRAFNRFGNSGYSNEACAPAVPAGYWARAWIEALFNAGVTGGCATAPLRYCPTATVTREQMAVFLVKAHDGASFTPLPCTSPPFADVPCSNLFAPWIGELATRGIMAGCGDGNYCPANPVTRQEMAVLLLRTLGVTPGGCTTAPFADVPCSSPFAPWIQELVARGITAGCSATSYCPTSAATRDQMAVFLVRTFSLPFPAPGGSAVSVAGLPTSAR